MLNSFAVPTLSYRSRVLVLAAVVLITALAWAYLIHLDQQMKAGAEYDAAMAAMGMNGVWTATDAFLAFAMWAVMMAGMMAPAAAPVLMLFAAARSKRSERGWLSVLIFALGYVVVWGGFSAGAVLVQWIFQQTGLLTTTMAAAPRLAAAILIGAGVYQWTPWKNRCLAHCRSPLGFLMSNWRDGALGSFRMGFGHGIYCLGCCWALMGVLFVVGVMNLLYVAALSVLVLIEKVGPAGATAARIAGVAMILLGVFEMVILS